MRPGPARRDTMAQRGRKHAAEAFLAVFACAATVEKTRPRPGWAEASLLAKILPLTSAWPKSRLRPSSVPAPCSALPVWKQAKHGATHRPAITAAVVRLEAAGSINEFWKKRNTMRLRSRLERLERRLHAGADKLAMCQFFELLASALAGDELSPEACRQLEELEEQLLPLERRQLARANRQGSGQDGQDGGGDDPGRLADHSKGWAGVGRPSWVTRTGQGGIVNFHCRLERLE